jgi:hypothetical protein
MIMCGFPGKMGIMRAFIRFITGSVSLVWFAKARSKELLRGAAALIFVPSVKNEKTP